MSTDERALGLEALTGLLDEFRQGHIVDLGAERAGMERHAGRLTARWNARFPGFPSEHFPYTSFWGEYYRGRRDAFLKRIVVKLLAHNGSADTTIVNPACVFGRHACDLASQLPHARVIATDIDPNWARLYRLARGGRMPGNYLFVQDNIFAPHREIQPTTVVFFGACGAVSDAALDYAIDSGATYLVCRTCCHDNIGGNVEITKRSNNLNRFFRLKNWAYGRMKWKARYAGYYFSDKYQRSAYPRSEAAQRVSNADEFQAVARDSPESDICRAIIDLDRYLVLVERGFSVLYQGELFVAERNEVEGVRSGV
ncbi:MAG TPA: hypothetical protein VK845_00150 [Gemmatimonadales bacterium]|nr:hypothetical protein [Gemmatimonadales bacterium]